MAGPYKGFYCISEGDDIQQYFIKSELFVFLFIHDHGLGPIK